MILDHIVIFVHKKVCEARLTGLQYRLNIVRSTAMCTLLSTGEYARERTTPPSFYYILKESKNAGPSKPVTILIISDAKKLTWLLDSRSTPQMCLTSASGFCTTA
mmetsp:Transcript_9704/g.14537  ORF Transcript_9704/g.14537 Transcript_9704/m.14537 type:complete len:105 (+) Transcript_9704:55-369(+)